jgi:N-methylhydantoinase A
MRERVIGAFHQRHQDEYGHSRLAEPPEITGVRLVASVPVEKPEFGSGMTAVPSTPSPATTRSANLGRGFEETRIYRGSQLAPGCTIEAPAIIEETFTTIVVYPGWRATLDDAGDYVLERVEDSR